MRYYDTWIKEQAALIVEKMHEYARNGITGNDVALWVIPSAGATPGRIHMGTEPPDGRMLPVVRFPVQGSAIMHTPYSHVHSLLWNACQSFPILPTEGEFA